jgi:hypothetical protein
MLAYCIDAAVKVFGEERDENVLEDAVSSFYGSSDLVVF